MAKKDKPSVDKIVKRVSKEFEKTTDRVEGMVSEAMKRFNEEIDRRLKELHELQDSLMERFGVGNDKATKDSPKSGTTTATASKTSAAAAKTTGKGATKAKPPKQAKSAASKPASKAASTKPAAAKAGNGKTAKAAPLNKSDLKKVKGIGPATEKKMKAAGITSIDQIANPSPEDQEKLESFSKVRGAEFWTAEAKKLL